MSNALIVDLSSTNTDDAPSGFADVLDLAQSSVNVGSASSVILMIAVVPLRQTDTADETAAFRFAIDDSLVGPEVLAYKDGVDEGCGLALCFATTVSAGNHKFALQWNQETGVAQTDLVRARSLQVIEIENATILVDKSSSATDDADAGFTDVVDLTDTQTVTSGSILLVLANMQGAAAGAPEWNTGHRFTVAGSFEGPELTSFKDNALDICGHSSLWMLDGISGSTAFAHQWDEIHGTATADTGNVRTLQVIEITAEATLHDNITTQAAHTFADPYSAIAGLTTTFTPDNSDSIILLAGGVQLSETGDKTGALQFADGGTLEGPEQYLFGDNPSGPDMCGHSIYYAVTGKSGSKTFTLQALDVALAPLCDTTRNRSFCALELKVPPPPIVDLPILLMGPIAPAERRL